MTTASSTVMPFGANKRSCPHPRPFCRLQALLSLHHLCLLLQPPLLPLTPTPHPLPDLMAALLTIHPPPTALANLLPPLVLLTVLTSSFHLIPPHSPSSPLPLLPKTINPVLPTLAPSPASESTSPFDDDNFTYQWEAGSGHHTSLSSPLTPLCPSLNMDKSTTTPPHIPLPEVLYPDSPPLDIEPHTIANSGATKHFLKYWAYFDLDSYTLMPSYFICLADHTDILVQGHGMTHVTISGIPISCLDCFHVPSLCTSLYSLCHHHHDPGCTYTAVIMPTCSFPSQLPCSPWMMLLSVTFPWPPSPTYL